MNSNMRPKASTQPFGVALKSAIREEFGTSKAFAAKLGITPGRVSQILKGPEDISTPTLVNILSAFSSHGIQERIHAAWVREFAPLPKTSIRDLEPDEALEKIHRLGVDGLPTRALAFAESWKAGATDPELLQALSRQVVEISLRLTRVAKAAQGLNEMKEVAAQNSEEPDIFTALWMKCLVLRALDRIPAKELLRAFEDARCYAESIRTKSTSSREKWLKQRAILDRDFALHILALTEQRKVPQEALNLAVKLINKSIEEGPDPVFTPYGLEMRARIEVAQGHLVKAEDTLDELQELGLPEGAELWEKAEFTRARILVERGELDEAISILERVSEDCFTRMNLHHHRKADQLLARLLLNMKTNP